MAHHSEADAVKVPLLSKRSPIFVRSSFLREQKEEDCIVDVPEGSHVPEKTTEENQNQEPGKHISRVHSALVKTNPDAYKPKLISIGPYYHINEPGSENSIKADFQKSFFGEIKGLKEDCAKKLTDLRDRARSWYTEDTKSILSDDQFEKMLLLDSCFMLEFFYKLKSGADDEFMKVDGKVLQTLSDVLLFENQLPFFVLFELHKLKTRYCSQTDNYDDLLEELIRSMKVHFTSLVPKLTPQNVVAKEYTPENLPNHLLQVIHNLCIPRKPRSPDNDSSGMIEQINTATELEKDGVSFKKIGKVYGGYNDKEGPNFNANDCTTLFDIDFNWGIMKIPCFKIDDYTETFLRNMIAYEQHSDVSQYFTDFACFMDELIDSPEDVSLLRRRGIIVNLLATDKIVAKMFNDMCEGVVFNNTFSGVVNKVNRHGEKAWNIWIGKLRQDYFYSPWKLISTIVGGIIFILGVVVTIKNVVK